LFFFTVLNKHSLQRFQLHSTRSYTPKQVIGLS